LTPDNLDLIAGWVSLVLTLMVFSYLLGDNILYRLALHVLIGAAAGYAAIVAAESVIVPWLDDTLLVERGDRDLATVTALRVVGTVPLLVGTLLLFKISRRLAPIGDLGLSFLIGVGVAVAIVGAVAGTIVPLAREAGEAVGGDQPHLAGTDGLVILVGVICTLIYFQYLAIRRGGVVQRPRWLQVPGLVGQFFVTITLGALYAGAILTSLAVFSDVIRAQLEFVLDRIGG
jgi:hypothetical protein